MKTIFENNRKWVEAKIAKDPNYFKNMVSSQAPNYLFIGCADSRVSSSEITGTDLGQMFVHRNIANMVVHTDVNLLSVLQYAVEVLKVKNVIVCGHYGCGGVKAAMGNTQFGLIDTWLTNIRDVIRLHESELSKIEDEDARWRRLVELNVIEQVQNLSKTSIIQNAMKSDNPPQLHGLVYDLGEGLLQDLQWQNSDFENLKRIYEIEKA